nr:single-stranded DNA-binding protein [Campylobacter sp. RM16187]
MFVDIVFFGRLAEVAKQYTSKGSKLLIEGRLVQESWRDTAGQNRSKHVIGVENMEMLGGDGGYSINTQNNTYSKNGHDTEVDDKVADARNFANPVAKKAKESKELDRNLEILNEEYDRVNETSHFKKALI